MTRRIGVQDETYERLKKMKSPGQSFNGVIIELLNRINEEKEAGDLPDRPGVYLIYQGGEILYVGQTSSIKRRCTQHVITNDPGVDVKFEVIEEKEERLRKEREMVEKHQPLLNKDSNVARNDYANREIIED